MINPSLPKKLLKRCFFCFLALLCFFGAGKLWAEQKCLPGHCCETPWEKNPYSGWYSEKDVQRGIQVQSYYGVSNNVANSPQEQTSLFKNSNLFPPEKEQVKETPPYRLKKGDKLYISIYGEDGTGREVVVDSMGYIYYLFTDPIFVVGKTIDEAKEELNEKIKAYFRHGIVTVTAVELAGSQYTIIGEVKTPGTKPIKGKTTLLDALADAGGVTVRAFRDKVVDYADLDHAFLAREGDYVSVDFKALVRKGDLRQDVSLEDGDYIYIPSVESHDIFVLGEVNSPLSFSFIDTVSLLEALVQAGGVTENASSRAIVIRGSLACPVNYFIDTNLIFKGCQPDFWLCPGDIVYVPPMRFTALKEILKAGIRTFVATAASSYGTRAVRSTLNPSRDILEPLPVIRFGETQTIIQPPVILP